LIEDTATNTHFINQTQTTTASTHIFSCYLKAGERSWATLYVSGANVGQYFNLSTGTVGSTFVGAPTSASIINVGNGWYRCAITFTSTTSSDGRIYVAAGDANKTYTGNGTSGIFIWGAQLEAGSFPTSYIPTVASTVTRAADIATIVAPMFAPWYNQSAGTFVVEADKLSATGFGYVLLANDGTSNQRFGMYQSNTAVAGFISAAGATQMEISSSPIVANTPFKAAVAAIANNGNFSFNGGIGVTDPSLAMPTPNRLDIGSFASGLQLNGHIRSINYYPLRLTNAQLQGLTT
jgi:hypothetical protein